MHTILQIALFSNTSLLRSYASGDWPTDQECRRFCFIRGREHNATLPDHAYKNRWESVFHSCHGIRSFLFKALEDLSQRHLRVEGAQIRVVNGSLASWQDMLTYVPPLPFLAFAIYRTHKWRSPDCGEIKTIAETLAKTALPSICDPGLDDLAAHHGLRDLHVHLNGSTEADWIWQDALKRPTRFARTVVKFQGQEAEELFLQLDEGLQPKDLRPLLNIAANLRWWLAQTLYSSIPPSPPTPRDFSLQGFWRDHRGPRRPHPRALLKERTGPDSDLYREVRLLIDLYGALEQDRHRNLAPMFHYYLLIQCYLNRLLVQQREHKGFDQFDKITRNGMRELSERSYFHRRFDGMEGMYGEDIVFLEGRFAPKENGGKLLKLLNLIHKEYARYKQAVERHASFGWEGATSKRMDLGLVGHFIKRLPRKTFCRYQHYHLRSSLERQARILLQVCRKRRFVKQLVAGCDAAGHELHTPPEVFAPIFRRLRHGGVTHFTYHAGEDFVHLISGIRATYEAAEFLDLRPGDRIGHATALGISAELWANRTGPTVVMRRPLLLDDLVFAWSLLRGDKGQEHNLAQLEREIRRLSRLVYGKTVSPDLLEEAWRLRCLDPRKIIVDSLISQSPLNPFDCEEWSNVKKAKEENPAAVDLFCLHHGKRIFEMTWGGGKNPSPYEEVITDFLPLELLTRLQHLVLMHINERQLALEAMPTSNVRISCYDCYDEHHIFTWLNLSRDPGYPAPIVCLCSDDPGIFSTNTRNEYAHVLDVLKRKYGKSHQEALEILNMLVENSRRYAFHPRRDGSSLETALL